MQQAQKHKWTATEYTLKAISERTCAQSRRDT